LRTVKAARIHRYGGNDHVTLDEIPRPPPAPKDLLVAVRAASVNPVDFKIRDGKVKILLPYTMPITLGNDLSGEVVEVGSEVTRFRPGDAIYARLDKDKIGAFAEYALVRESAAAKKPGRLSHVEAASIPLVGLTSWQAMVEIGGLGPGKKVLVHAGSGGVGTFAIQLGRHLGAHVVTTVGTSNVELAKRLGAETIVDYRAARFEDTVSDCDVVFDTLGGETLERSFAVVKRGGVVVSVGGVPDRKFARAWGLNPLIALALGFMMRKVTRLARERGARFEYLFMRASGEQLETIGDLVEKRIIEPVLDRTFSLSNVKEALAYVEAGRTVGKVVITMEGA
jgi:NADPH:quinone reductase-like Zn-dependent oxidoreductase